MLPEKGDQSIIILLYKVKARKNRVRVRVIQG